MTEQRSQLVMDRQKVERLDLQVLTMAGGLMMGLWVTSELVMERTQLNVEEKTHTTVNERAVIRVGSFALIPCKLKQSY